MDDEAGEKEADKNGALHVDLILVMTGRLGKAEEEKESTDEKGRIVGKDDGPGEEEEMGDGDPFRDRVFAFAPSRGNVHVGADGGLEFCEFSAEGVEVNDVGENDSQDGLPAKVEEHVAHTEAPFFGDHEDGRSGEMGEGAADGDVDEEETEGGVGELGGGIEIVEFLREKEGRDRHGGRLGNEGSEDRCDGKSGEPPGGGGAAEDFGDFIDEEFGKANDGASGGHGHDDNDEERLGEIHIVPDVGFDFAKTGSETCFLDPEEPEDGSGEGDDPDSKDGFDFT